MLITAAPARTARAIPRAESAHVIRWPSGSGMFSVRAPGPTGGATAAPTTEARQPDAGLAESASGAWLVRPIRFGSA